MRQLVTLLLALTLIGTLPGNSCTSSYIVTLKDKDTVAFYNSPPSNYLSKKSLTRRSLQGIPIDITDFPVNASYISALKNVAKVKYHLKWNNAVIVQIEDSTTLNDITRLKFVQKIQKIKDCITSSSAGNKFELTSLNKASGLKLTDKYNYWQSADATFDVNLQTLHQIGLTGKNMLIGVFDAGYSKVDSMDAFAHLWERNGIKAEEDIVTGGKLTYTSHRHGTWVLSIMAGYLPDQYRGGAIDANYALYRTEDGSSETKLEEYNWQKAAEHADSIGVDIINSSLSYTTFDNPDDNYTYNDLDGKTTIIAQAATMAASKGILVVASAGNYGNSSWKYIGSPADADNILTVGAVRTDSTVSNFSSIGPTADARLKPNVVALGEAIAFIHHTDEILVGSGTSFSSPLIASGAACLWQFDNTASNLDILQSIELSSHLYNSPSNNYGYGIPNFYKALEHVNSTQFNKALGNTEIQVYPNPFVDNVTIQITVEQNTEAVISIHQHTGSVILEQKALLREGVSSITLATPYRLESGIYWLSVVGDNLSLQSKLVKMNLD